MAGPGLTDPSATIGDLRRAGADLRGRPTVEIAADIATLCAKWRDSAWAPRRSAEEALAAHYGVPTTAIAEIVDAAFGTWTESELLRWVTSELGEGALDASPGSVPTGRKAVSPRLVTVLAASGVPTTPIGDIIASLMVKAPVWLHVGSGGDELAHRFAATLLDVVPDLGRAVHIDRSAETDLRASAMNMADVVVVTGRAETVAAVRAAIGPGSRIVAHGPRLSAAVVSAEALRSSPDRIADLLASDVAFAGQRGCLSPVVAYVEAGEADTAAWVGTVFEACRRRWPAPPRRERSMAERAVFSKWRATLDVRMATGGEPRWRGDANEAWTVVVQTEYRAPETPLLPRFLTLASGVDLDAVPELLAYRRGAIATVGVAADDHRAGSLAAALADAGVERVTRLGSMQRPPADWRRDGRPILADLVTWIDIDIQ